MSGIYDCQQGWSVRVDWGKRRPMHRDPIGRCRRAEVFCMISCVVAGLQDGRWYPFGVYTSDGENEIMETDMKSLSSFRFLVSAAAAMPALAALVRCPLFADDAVGVVQVGPTTNDVTTAQMPFTPMGESKFQNWQLRC